MSDWKSLRAGVQDAASSGDVAAVRAGLRALLDIEESARVFALGARSAELLDGDALTSVSVLVLRSYTVEPMAAPLVTHCLVRGIRLRVDVADYDQFEQVLLGEGRDAVPDVVLLLATIADLEPALATGFASLSADDIVAASHKAPGRALDWLQAIRRRWPNATSMLAGVGSPTRPSYGLADSSIELSQRRAIANVNEALRQGCRSQVGAIFLDVDDVISRVGSDNAFDARMWAHARQPYSPLALAALAKRVARTLAARYTKRRKCVVLDCDNTLWGGIVGEDGAAGIALGPEHPGSSYVAFQRSLLDLYQRGIILAICSKNNEADVLDVLANHRHQVLREEHFAATSIGWGDKATGIETLARQLNIGLDSLVFIDDSDYECALVRERLPSVEVVQAPWNPLELPDLVSRIESLDALTVSADDRKRGQMYKAQAKRSIAEGEAPSLDDFLRSLELEIEVTSPTEPGEIDRAAQLCQRTNQFNVTTRRHQVTDIEAMVEDDDTVLRLVRLRDRFGDYGLCGLAIAKLSGERFAVDTFLLSCRVIGRGVEDALIADLEEQARERGARHIEAEFIATAKNAPASDLFERLGFSRTGETDGAIAYQRALDADPREWPDWFTVVR